MHRFWIAVTVAGALAVLISGAASAATDPMHDSLVYCDEGVDGGATGIVTDTEHSVIVGDLPLPANVHRFRTTVDGISTPVMEAGPPDAQEAVVFIHGHPGSSRDFDQLVSADTLGRAQAAVLSKRPRPALVVWGQEDPYVPFTLANAQKQAFPDARVHVLPWAGHWPFVDHPDEPRDLIVPFLRGVIGS